MIQVDSDRYTQMTRILYDTNWNRLPVTIKYLGKSEDDPRPLQLQKMLDLIGKSISSFFFYTCGHVHRWSECEGWGIDKQSRRRKRSCHSFKR